MAERLSYKRSREEDTDNEIVSVVLHDRNGQPYSAALAIIREGSERVDLEIHRSHGGHGESFGTCDVLGDGCNAEAVGIEGFPEKPHKQVRELAKQLQEIHPTKTPKSTRLLELRASLEQLLQR